MFANSLTTLYTALIQPYLTYCITIWGHTYSTYLSKLHLLTKKIVRIIHNADFIAHTEELFKRSKMLNIYQLYKYFVSIFVYKWINRDVPNKFCNYFRRSVTKIFTNNLQYTFHAKKICEFSIKVTGPKLWNNIPMTIRSLNSLNYFKSKIKKYLLTCPVV